MDSDLILLPEVAEALRQGNPVVALESTLIAHGLPTPRNFEVAIESEKVVRSAGAVPATIAVLGGQLRIGLHESELQAIARSKEVRKAGRRDLGAAIASGTDAATTVSATLWAAQRAGISVFATGGLGGVHRNATVTFDVSADLDELARADGAVVVCSGVKAILDLPATLEALETLGVCVIGYQTSELPAFLTRSSGLPLEHRVESPCEAASLIDTHRRLRVPGALVLAQPVPEAQAMDATSLQRLIDQSVEEAEAAGVMGKSITPWLLERIQRASAGESLEANIALILNNARLAGQIAVALQQGDS